MEQGRALASGIDGGLFRKRIDCRSQLLIDRHPQSSSCPLPSELPVPHSPSAPSFLP